MDSIIIFGAQYLYLAIVLIALLFIARQPKEIRWKIALCAVIALPVTYIVAKILSTFYYDPRPFVVGNFVPLLPHAADNGFPSEHTLFSSAIAAVLFFFHRKTGLLLFFLAFLVGLSRVFAEVHHFIDIFGSIVIAAVVTAIVFEYVFPKAWEIFSQRYEKLL